MGVDSKSIEALLEKPCSLAARRLPRLEETLARQLKERSQRRATRRQVTRGRSRRVSSEKREGSVNQTRASRVKEMTVHARI